MDFKPGNPERISLTKNFILSKFKPDESLNEEPQFFSLIADTPSLFIKESLHPENSKQHLSDLAFDNALITQHPKLETRGQIVSVGTPIGSPPKKFEIRHSNFEVFANVRTPFSNSRFSSSLSERAWFYIDEQGVIQGPFTSLEMDNWFEKGYFFDELSICHISKSKNFFPLMDFLKL